MQTIYVGNVPHDFPDSMSEEQIADVLKKEYPPSYQPDLNSFDRGVNSVLNGVGDVASNPAVAGPLKFAGNLAGLLTSVPNGAIEGFQDKGFSPAGVLEAAKDAGRALIDPFIPGQNPTQSTATSLRRMGVTDQQTDNRTPVYGSDGRPMNLGSDVARDPGLATALGNTIDFAAPLLVGPGEVGAAARAVGADKALGAVGDFAKGKLAARAADLLDKEINPTAGQIRHGYTIETLKNNGLGGTLENGSNQVNDLMALYGGNLDRALQAAPVQNRVDALQLVANMPKPMMSELEASKVEDELTKILENTGDGSGVLSVPDANVFKQKLGQLAYDNGRSIEPSGIKQQLYDAVRQSTKNEIERQAAGMGPEVAAANAQLSPMFSVRSALENRLGGLDPAKRPGWLGRIIQDAKSTSAFGTPGQVVASGLEMTGHPGVATAVEGALAVKKIGTAAFNELARSYAADPSMALLARSMNVSKDVAIRGAILANITGKAIPDAVNDVSSGTDIPENHVQQE